MKQIKHVSHRYREIMPPVHIYHPDVFFSILYRVELTTATVLEQLNGATGATSPSPPYKLLVHQTLIPTIRLPIRLSSLSLIPFPFYLLPRLHLPPHRLHQRTHRRPIQPCARKHYPFEKSTVGFSRSCLRLLGSNYSDGGIGSCGGGSG